jgi:hypothetical protein
MISAINKTALRHITGLAGLVMLFMQTVVHADDVLYTYPGTGFADTNDTVTLGYQFSPAVDLTVSSLGVYDGGIDGAGLQAARDVGLYTDTGTLLASVSVDNSDPLINGFRFAAVSPLVLSAAQTYVLAAYYTTGPNGEGDKDITTVLNSHPLVTVTSHILGEGGASLTFPTVTVSSTDFSTTANMLFTANTPLAHDGDLDFDGDVDAADVLLATRIVTGSLTPTANQLFAGDVAPRPGGLPQPDNVITAGDLLSITRAAMGLLTL